jgi:hypothetical protein
MKNRFCRTTGALFLFLAVCITAAVDSLYAQRAAVQGIVTDQQTGQPLEGANVSLNNLATDVDESRGMASDQNGFYQITNLRPGAWVIRISYIGYITYKDTLGLSEGETRTVSVSLEPDQELLDEIFVAPVGGAARLEAGRQRITTVDIQRVPVPGGSGDLASYLQGLPGVVTMGDRGGQFYIRGGTPTENMVLVDGTMIYQPFHILGFFSVFPSDLISEVDFYAGGFSPRYNGRMSSVLDVKMRAGDRYQAGGSATVSPFLGEVLVESPLRSGRASVIASVRRSLIEETSPWFMNDQQNVRFESQYLKLNHFGVSDTRCSAMIMRTYDRGQLDFEAGEVFKWSNFLFGGRCVVLPTGSDLLFDLNAGISHVSNAVGESRDPERFSKVTRFNLDLNLTRYYRQVRLNYGLFVLIKSLSYDMHDQFRAPQQESDHLFSGGGYLETVIPVGDRVRVNFGTLLAMHREKYNPSLEPRVRFSWQPPALPDAELNLSFGRYTQYLVGMRDTRDASSVFTAWVAEPSSGVRTESLHGLLGWRQAIGSGFFVSAEGYYKRHRNVPVTVWSMLAEFTTDLALADGQTYGSDFRLEYNRHPFYSFVGYGYSWTEYESAQDHFGIWFGEPVQRYHPPHDRRHQVNGLFSLTLGAYNVALRWELGTGMPYTRPMGFDEIFFYNERLPDLKRDYGTTRVLLEKPYQDRTPVYHRLDLSMERTFTFNRARFVLQAGAINLYDRANLFYYDAYTHRRVDQLPFVPYISLKMEL